MFIPYRPDPAGFAARGEPKSLPTKLKRSPPSASDGAPAQSRAELGAQFNQIRTRRIFEEICAQVRREMAAGTLRPGDKLPTEREFAAKFAVSRTAVREALRTLEIAGVVGLQKGVKGGAFILEGDPELITRSVQDLVLLGRISLNSLTETRTVILQAAVGLAAERITPQILAALESNTDELARLSKSSAAADRVRISAAFYNLLGKATGNELLHVIVTSLTEIVLQRVAARRLSAMPKLIEHRRRLTQMLAKHDIAGAQSEIGQHLQALHRHLLRDEQDREAARARS